MADALQNALRIGGDMGRSLAVFASFLLAMAPYHAALAQDARNVSVTERRQPDYDAPGMRLGGFDLNATLDLAVVHSDNIFAEEVNERDDTFIEVRPEAMLRSHWSRHEVRANVGATFSQYDSYTSEDANSGWAGVGGRYDIGRATAIGADLNATRGVESRTDPDAAFSDEPVEYDIRSASAYVSHEFNRLRLRGTISQTEFDYHDVNGAILDQDLRDNTIYAVGGRAEYILNPRVSLLGQISADEREYDIDSSQDSEGQTLLAGIKLDLTNLLRGEFSAGQFQRDYDNGGDVDGVAVSGRVHWFATPLTTVTFDAQRDVQDSSILTPYVNTRLAVRADHELRRNILIYAGVRNETHEFEYDNPGESREDDIMIYDVGGRYLMNRRVSFNASYMHNDTTSDGLTPYRDFKENRIRLGVRFSL